MRHRRKWRLAFNSIGVSCIIVGILLLCAVVCWLIFRQNTASGETMNSDSPAVIRLTRSEIDEGEEPAAEETSEEPAEEQEGDELTDEEKLEIILSDDGDIYPARLQKEVTDYPQTIDFVYHYPEYVSRALGEIDLSEEAEQDSVPLLIQWDSRWGYQPYGGGLIGYAGCGPTALSMVVLYLTNDPDMTPLYIADWADSAGYFSDGGTSWGLMSTGCSEFGLKAETLSLTEEAMKQALDEGKPIICNVGPGDFTVGGHYIVVTGYTDEGFTVNDSNSPENSAKVWPFDVLQDQIKILWAYSVAD